MDPQAPATQHSPGQEAVAEFVLSFVQALLRTGYYLPDHPQARRAKEGLHRRFESLFQGRQELTFMVQDLGETSSILVEGALPETQRLSALMPTGMAEVYAPRLAHFLERKDLVSLTLKEGMEEEEFSHFIDVLSEPGGGGLDAAGRERFVTHLNENGITHFSLVFKEDLVAPERRLPWRAQLAISRLKKDLKQVPLFHDLDAAGLRLLRQQTLHEVLRPISRPDLLAALLMNSDLAMSPEVSEEEIEEELAGFIPDFQVVPTGRAALQAHLASADPEAAPRQRRALQRLLLRPPGKDLPGVAELVRELFERGLVEFDRLPAALQTIVSLERDTDRFLAERSATLKRLEQATDYDAYRVQAQALLRLVPELLRRQLLEEVLVLVTTLRGHAALGGGRSAAAAEALERLASGEMAAAFKEKFLTGRKEERAALAPTYLALGERMRPQLLEILREAPDGWVRKNASEVLLRMGPEATDAVLAEIASGKLPAAAVAELVMVFGELRSDRPGVLRSLHAYARSRDPHLREEAAWALCRIRGAAEEGLFLQLLADPELGVRRRALRCLRAARCGGAFGHLVALLSRVEDEPGLEALESSLYAALPELAEAAGSADQEVEEWLVVRLEQSFPHGLLAALHRPQRPLGEDALLALCDALGAVGTRTARDVLGSLSHRLKDPYRQHLLRAVQRIDSRMH